MFVAKRAYSAANLWKKVSASEFEIVIVNVRHRRKERQGKSALRAPTLLWFDRRLSGYFYPRQHLNLALRWDRLSVRCRSQSFVDGRSSSGCRFKTLAH